MGRKRPIAAAPEAQSTPEDPLASCLKGYRVWSNSKREKTRERVRRLRARRRKQLEEQRHGGNISSDSSNEEQTGTRKQESSSSGEEGEKFT